MWYNLAMAFLPGYKKGFTIVELLIVIVVIAILATISIVAYGNIQDRGLVSRSIADLQTANKAIQLYFIQNGSYPDTASAWRSTNTNPTDYVPGVVPSVVSGLPISSIGTTGLTGAYIYRSNGTDYKLIAHTGHYTTVCGSVKSRYPELIDPIRDCWGYGYWSPGGSGF